MTVLIKTLFHFVYAENYQKRNNYVMKLRFLVENTERAHRIWKAYKDKNTGEKSQSHNYNI